VIVDAYTRDRVAEELDAGLIGRSLHWHATLPSTNEEAMRLAAVGAAEGTVVIAEEQTAGRGRRGRGWTSPAGGVWLSVVLRPALPVGGLPLIGLAAAVAAARAIQSAAGLRAKVKWPNDVLVGGAKVAGILTEAGPAAAWTVLGIGLNANVPAALLPHATPYPVTSLLEQAGGPIDRGHLTVALLRELDHAYAVLRGNGRERVLAWWRECSDTLGRPVRVETMSRVVEGLAVDVDGDGALLLRTPRGIERIVAGDVTLSGAGRGARP